MIFMFSLFGRITGQVRRALQEFNMIQSGDRLALGLSGGKDSLTLLTALAELQRYYPVPFELVAITVDLGFEASQVSETQREDVGRVAETLGGNVGRVAVVDQADVGSQLGAEMRKCTGETQVAENQCGEDRLSVTETQAGVDRLSVAQAQCGEDRLSVTKTQAGEDRLSVAQAQCGDDRLSVTKTQAGEDRLSVTQAQCGEDRLSVTKTQAGATPFCSLTQYCRSLGVEHSVIATHIGKIVLEYKTEENPCSLCANMRRGALSNAAKVHGCNKVILAHNKDDLIETMLLSLFYEGRISTFSPVTYLDRTQLHVLRPLIFTEEKDILSYVTKRAPFSIIKNPCPVDGNTKRQFAKDLLKELSIGNRHVKPNIFGAIKRDIFGRT